MTERFVYLTAAAAVLAAAAPSPAGAVTIEIAHAYGFQREMHEAIAERFMELNPDIDIVLRATVDNYETLVQQTRREALVGDLADVMFHGFNRIQLVAEHAVPLDPFIAAEPDWSALGYAESAQSLARVGDTVFGLPFAVSTPVIYYNADLVAEAGGDPDAFPDTWEGVIALSEDVDALSDDIMGGYMDWTSGANWEFIALVGSQAGAMMNEDRTEVTFDGPEGLYALGVFEQFGQAGQIDMSDDQAMQAFAAGTLGIMVGSSARTIRLTNQIGDRFDLRAAPFPLPSEEGRLPAGGNAAVMFADDPETQQAAWEYIKFATGAMGQTMMVRHTGYVPSNTLAVEDPDLLGRFYEENPNLLTSIGQLPVMTAFFAFPGVNALRVNEALRDELRFVVALEKTPEQAMADMVAEAERLLADE